MYVVGYSIGRFWIEGLRIDPAHTTGGLRLNQWVALVVGVTRRVVPPVDWSASSWMIPPIASTDVDGAG